VKSADLHDQVVKMLCCGGEVGEGGMLASAVTQAVCELHYLADAEFDRDGGRNNVSHPLHGIAQRLELALDLHVDAWVKSERDAVRSTAEGDCDAD
jgi:hypothetical protein